jgi:DNA polymerase-3 subunit gamma/tau
MKGLEELRNSPRPLQSADMVLVRLAYAAKMPTPSDALKLLDLGEDLSGSRGALKESLDRKTPASTNASTPVSVKAERGPNLISSNPMRSFVATSPTVQVSQKLLPVDSKQVEAISVIENFQELIALAETKRDMRLKIALENDVRLVHFEHGRIEFELAPGGARDLASNLIQKIQAWTNERWVISVVASGGKSTVKEQRMLKEREKRTDLESDPLVAAVMIEFPGAQIISVRGGEDPNSSAEILEILYDDFAAEDND